MGFASAFVSLKKVSRSMRRHVKKNKRASEPYKSTSWLISARGGLKFFLLRLEASIWICNRKEGA